MKIRKTARREKTLVPDFKRDVQEWYIRETLPDVLDTLLIDRTMTKKNGRNTNIIWATDDYAAERGKEFAADREIRADLISRQDDKIICPRVDKRLEEQHKRSVEKAEVFTPSWVCNKQNNLVDEAWFGRKKDLFNIDKPHPVSKLPWTTTCGKFRIRFPKRSGKEWTDYVSATRLEVSCGEAPYLTSRYDTTTGEMISVSERIGLLDRKLRVITEYCEGDPKVWRDQAEIALQNVYGFEWQGDNVFLARENVLYAVLEAFTEDFGGMALDADTVRRFAEIVSWNIWQMDGIKFVVPNSCRDVPVAREVQPVFAGFGEAKQTETTLPLTVKCKGCATGNVHLHNGVRCIIKDWKANELVEFKPPFNFTKGAK